MLYAAGLALKLWTIERKSHAMALVADPGLALFPGLNAFPKKSYLSEYSSRITPSQTAKLLGAWHDRAQNPGNLCSSITINRSISIFIPSLFTGKTP